MLKKSTLLTVSICVVLVIGLSDYGYGHHRNDHTKGGGGDDGGTDQYSVSVSFDDNDCDTGAAVRPHFCSDGGGDYVDGEENVTAGGDKFRLSLTLQTPALRSFFLDFSDKCVDDPSCGDVPVLTSGPTGLTSGFGNGNVFSIGEPGFSLLDMEVGDMKPRLVVISFRDNENHAWGLSFNPDDCAGSNLVSVTRITDSAWEFVPSGGEIACLERAKNGNKGPPILQGLYRMPFKFTVTLL